MTAWWPDESAFSTTPPAQRRPISRRTACPLIPANWRSITASTISRHAAVEKVEWVFSKDAERVQAVFPGYLALEDENSYVSAAEAGWALPSCRPSL